MIVLCQLLKTASECACVVTPEVFGSGQNDHSKRICYSKSAKNTETKHFQLLMPEDLTSWPIAI